MCGRSHFYSLCLFSNFFFYSHNLFLQAELWTISCDLSIQLLFSCVLPSLKPIHLWNSQFSLLYFLVLVLLDSFSNWLYHIFHSLKKISSFFIFWNMLSHSFRLWLIILISEIFCGFVSIFFFLLAIFFLCIPRCFDFVLIYYWKIISKNDFRCRMTVPTVESMFICFWQMPGWHYLSKGTLIQVQAYSFLIPPRW